MPASILICLYLAVALLPTGLAWVQGLPPRSFADELASGAGLVALSVLLAEFLLLGRVRLVTRRVGSDVVMRVHQLLARGALALAFLHPLLYQTRRYSSFDWDESRRLTVAFDFHSLWPGIAALLLLGAVVAMAINRTSLGYRYEIWRLLHGVGAAAVAGFGVLHALRAGRYSADPVLGWVWLAMLVVAAGALARVYLLTPLAQLRRPWRVRSVVPVARGTWELSLTPARKGPLRYEAGQFAWLNIGHSPFTLNENPFSLSSAPSNDGHVSFIIKELGDFTDRIGMVKPGTRAYLDGPHGHLAIAGRKEPGIALIAGGVGIAPLIGILRELSLSDDPRPTVLLYGNRKEDQIARRDELATISQEHGTEIVHVLSEPAPGWDGETGMITEDLLRRHFDSPARRKWLFVLCGPPPMLEAVEDALIALGVPATQILSERFSYD